jgi:hypothetical protein
MSFQLVKFKNDFRLLLDEYKHHVELIFFHTVRIAQNDHFGLNSNDDINQMITKSK